MPTVFIVCHQSGIQWWDLLLFHCIYTVYCFVIDFIVVKVIKYESAPFNKKKQLLPTHLPKLWSRFYETYPDGLFFAETRLVAVCHKTLTIKLMVTARTKTGLPLFTDWSHYEGHSQSQQQQ